MLVLQREHHAQHEHAEQEVEYEECDALQQCRSRQRQDHEDQAGEGIAPDELDERVENCREYAHESKKINPTKVIKLCKSMMSRSFSSARFAARVRASAPDG